MKLYCLSGLGVDERAFLNFKPDGVELIHIPWIRPEKNELLETYALRLFNTLDLPNDYSLLGVSFGGMIATEFAKHRNPKHLFLVSTISGYKQLPIDFWMGRYIPLHKIAPIKLLKSSNAIVRRKFGIRSPEDKALLAQILQDTDTHFLRWAMNAILLWENKNETQGIRIHGSNDKMLPIQDNVDYVIDGGGHFMIVNRADEISAIVHTIIQNYG